MKDKHRSVDFREWEWGCCYLMPLTVRNPKERQVPVMVGSAGGARRRGSAWTAGLGILSLWLHKINWRGAEWWLGVQTLPVVRQLHPRLQHKQPTVALRLMPVMVLTSASWEGWTSTFVNTRRHRRLCSWTNRHFSIYSTIITVP